MTAGRHEVIQACKDIELTKHPLNGGSAVRIITIATQCMHAVLYMCIALCAIVQESFTKENFSWDFGPSVTTLIEICLTFCSCVASYSLEQSQQRYIFLVIAIPMLYSRTSL